jgi:hypothetical protein
VQHLHPDPVRRADLGCEAQLLERVELGLHPPPVVAVGPVAAQLLDVGERDALAPVVDRFPLRPSGAAQAVGEVVEVGLRDVDLIGRGASSLIG